MSQSTPPPKPNLFSSAKEFIHRHKKWEPVVFFIAGFSFDAVLLHRIDDPLMLTHQAIYLSLCAAIIAWDLFGEVSSASAAHEPRLGGEPQPKQMGSVRTLLAKIWSYREGVLHFMLGTLLNVYTIFYFKSGTVLTSILFLGLLASLLFLNEARPVHVPKHVLRNALFSLCLISYLNILVSIIAGSIGTTVFIVALAVSAVIHTLFSLFLKRRLATRKILYQVQVPFWSVLAIYAFAYFMRVLPPVPLSVKHIGIYHGVVRVEGGYRLEYHRPEWRFWETGDQTFEAAPGDRLFCFVQVYSPAKFHDQLKIRWRYHDTRTGWSQGDAIPIAVSGGREDGFRGFTTKANYVPGEWRAEVETSDGREIGRIAFTVETATSSQEPRFTVR